MPHCCQNIDWIFLAHGIPVHKYLKSATNVYVPNDITICPGLDYNQHAEREVTIPCIHVTIVQVILSQVDYFYSIDIADMGSDL